MGVCSQLREQGPGLNRVDIAALEIVGIERENPVVATLKNGGTEAPPLYVLFSFPFSSIVFSILSMDHLHIGGHKQIVVKLIVISKSKFSGQFLPC